MGLLAGGAEVSCATACVLEYDQHPVTADNFRLKARCAVVSMTTFLLEADGGNLLPTRALIRPHSRDHR